VTAQRSKTTDDDHRVIPFPARSAVPGSGHRGRSPTPSPRQTPPPVEGLAKYEGGEGDDDYRHRMMVNLAALAVTIMLAIAGGWLAMQIADMRKQQDCFLSGRRNCAPIDVNAVRR
jgi:hypothetical protein